MRGFCDKGYRFGPCESCAFAVGKEGRFSPCRQGVVTLLRLTIYTRVLGMLINAEGTPIDLGGSHLDQFQERYLKLR
jgi:hypothetical protein